VLTEDGLRRIALDSVGRIKLANRELDKEFRQALSVLARGHDTDKKTVTLKFLGEGQRNVRVGYIQEAPVWKTSYRLVLDDNEDDFAFVKILLGKSLSFTYALEWAPTEVAALQALQRMAQLVLVHF
jgi:hypothetical protein